MNECQVAKDTSSQKKGTANEKLAIVLGLAVSNEAHHSGDPEKHRRHQLQPEEHISSPRQAMTLPVSHDAPLFYRLRSLTDRVGIILAVPPPVFPGVSFGCTTDFMDIPYLPEKRCQESNVSKSGYGS
jgi:hypothetical protein